MLGALLPVLLLATGCGIRATDVVEAGEPATVEVGPADQLGTLLYFVSSSSASRLMPVVRKARTVEVGDGAWGRPGRPGRPTPSCSSSSDPPGRSATPDSARSCPPAGRAWASS